MSFSAKSLLNKTSERFELNMLSVYELIKFSSKDCLDPGTIRLAISDISTVNKNI
jgi:hypothetical protein